MPNPTPPAPFIVRRFLAWAQRADAPERAEGASALARAYLHADLPPALRGECLIALAALADDRDRAVRRALAEAFSGERGAPRALVAALASDRSEIAAPLLARSPVLDDAVLVDCVAEGDVAAQCAVARRPSLGAGPAAALIEVGEREAALVLAENPSATLAPASVRRLVERFGADAEIRAALHARLDLPAAVAAEIVIAAPADPEVPKTRRFAARDATLARIAARRPESELPEFVRTLRENGALTMALVLRSLLGGGRALFCAALAELSGLPLQRASALARDPRGSAFAAAASRAGLPPRALPVFRAALAADSSRGPSESGGLRAELVGETIAACEAEDDSALAPYLAYLWRLAAEAAQAQAAALPVPLPRNLDFPPANDDASAAPALGAALPESAEELAPPVELPADLIFALNAA